ncbi:MAG: hypothetical protein ABI551_03795, partial [Polyangiaceae bacterium]
KLSSVSAAALLILGGCSKSSTASSPAPTPPSTSSTTTTTTTATATATSTTATTNTASVEEHDFEDQFAYGEFDAGVGDPSALTKRPGYDGYGNGRFGFSLDVPNALTVMPEPTNGDGMQWRLGHIVAMTASGMNYLPELGLSCAASKNVTAHRATKTSCWATGKRDGMIYWEKQVVARDAVFSLRFEYAEALKTQMDPIVTHVSASWKF